MVEPIDNDEEIILKILLLGDTKVGKTRILLKYIDGYFLTTYVTTIGVEYKEKKLNINKNLIKL